MRVSRQCVRCVVVLAVAAGIGSADDSAVEYVVQIDAGDHDRRATPIVVDLPVEFTESERFELQSADSADPLPLQRLPGETRRALFVLQEPLAAGESRSYRLLSVADSDAEPNDRREDRAVRCIATEDGIRINLHEHPVLQYNVAVVEPPEGIEGIYRRSGYIHPVATPAGRIVTEEFPEDHPHQHGIFNAWVNTTFEGRAVDFWNQKAETGFIEHVSVSASNDGEVFAQFRTELRHVDLSGPEGTTPVLDEQMLLRAFNVPRGHLFDIETRQVCIAESPLIINEFHYGGMAYRGAAEWLGQPEHDFLTSERKTRADGNHTRPVWVAAHGLVEGERCAIVFFGHPENFRHPQPVRLHPSKPYFVFTPPVLGEFSIAPEQEYVARYRCLVHDGPVDPEWYDHVWRDIADPPSVRVTEARNDR